MFPRTCARAIARVADRAGCDGPARALARIDGFDQRRRGASCGVGRRRGHDRCGGNADGGTGTSWARLVFAARRRVVRVGDRPARRLDRTNDENPGALLTLASGVAIAEAVRAVTGLPAEIKWPNDVMIGGRKLAGILAEAAVQAGALQFIVVGFGVNLQPAAYPPRACVACHVDRSGNDAAGRSRVDARRDSCGDGRAVRRSACRKVRCYSERLAAARAVSARRAR